MILELESAVKKAPILFSKFNSILSLRKGETEGWSIGMVKLVEGAVISKLR